MMNEQEFRRRLSDELTSLSLHQTQKENILDNLDCQSTHRPLRLSAAAAIIICISLLVVGAMAWLIVPTIADWFAQRSDPHISSAFLQCEPIDTSLAKQRVGDVTVTVWEAMADEKTFVTNTQFQYENDGDVKLIAFSGLTDEIRPEEDTLYVSAVSYYGNVNHEIYHVIQTDEHTLSILSEGWQKSNLSDTLFIEITLTSALEPEPVKITIEVPVKRLATLERYSLKESILFSKTGFILNSITLIRTELRIYCSYDISGTRRPLVSAIRPLAASVVDQNGTHLPFAFPYGMTVPEMLMVQVVDEDSGDIVEQIQLQLKDNYYIPLQTTEEEIQ